MDTDDYVIEELDDDYNSRILWIDCSNNEQTNIQVTEIQLIKNHRGKLKVLDSNASGS